MMMFQLLTVLSDLIVIIFDLLFYLTLLPQREHTKIPRIFKFICCFLIIFAYFFMTYFLRYPAAATSAMTMGIPSFILFLYYSKYRDSRFVLTFCFVDTISLMVAFISKVIGLFVTHGTIISILIALCLFIILYYFVLKYKDNYKKLLDEVDTGWGIMAFSTILIYFALVFIASYPDPLIDRLEYIPVWFTVACVVISCYVVFLHSIMKTKKINQQNKLLMKEREIYSMAFLDGLTKLYNRASYIEKINELERTRKNYDTITILAADVNEFKDVNDQYGHLEGDRVLKAVASSLKIVFMKYDTYLFRMGGDEFLVILPDISDEELKKSIEEFHETFQEILKDMQYTVTIATGYHTISTHSPTTLEDAYALADKQMYIVKAIHKQRYYS